MLNGARTPDYVDDALGILAWPPLPDAVAVLAAASRRKPTERADAVRTSAPSASTAERRVLWRGDALVEVAPRALDLLVALVERAGDVVTKEELLQRVWPDTFVEEANLSVNVSALRKALGDGPGRPRRTSRPSPAAATGSCAPAGGRRRAGPRRGRASPSSPSATSRRAPETSTSAWARRSR